MLRAKCFRGFRYTANHVSKACHLVNDLLRSLALFHQLHDDFGDRLDRLSPYRRIDALAFHQFRPLFDRDEFVVACVRQLGNLGIAAVVQATTAQRIDQHINSRGQVVQFDGLVLILAILGDRRHLPRRFDRPNRLRARPEVTQSERVILHCKTQIRRTLRDYMHLARGLVPNGPDKGALEHVVLVFVLVRRCPIERAFLADLAELRLEFVAGQQFAEGNPADFRPPLRRADANHVPLDVIGLDNLGNDLLHRLARLIHHRRTVRPGHRGEGRHVFDLRHAPTGQQIVFDHIAHHTIEVVGIHAERQAALQCLSGNPPYRVFVDEPAPNVRNRRFLVDHAAQDFGVGVEDVESRRALLVGLCGFLVPVAVNDLLRTLAPAVLVRPCKRQFAQPAMRYRGFVGVVFLGFDFAAQFIALTFSSPGTRSSDSIAICAPHDPQVIVSPDFGVVPSGIRTRFASIRSIGAPSSS